jgi:carbon starvation protein
VGPVLAAQMGYLPGLLWILAGVVFAGAVQDFIILFISTRRDGRSLGDLIKQEMGVVPGMIALFGTFMIMIIILAVLALIVVKALAESPWGTFTVARRFRWRCSWASTCATCARGASARCR